MIWVRLWAAAVALSLLAILAAESRSDAEADNNAGAVLIPWNSHTISSHGGLVPVPFNEGNSDTGQVSVCPLGYGCAQPIGPVTPLKPLPDPFQPIPEVQSLFTTPPDIVPDLSKLPRLSEEQMRTVLWQAGWPAELHDEALAVSFYESNGWQPGITSWNGCCRGLFQIHTFWWEFCGLEDGDLFDPVTNAQCAREIIEYEEAQGHERWSNWCVKPSGRTVC